MVRTRTLAVDRDAPDGATLREAARVLRAGGLVAFATETVYGLGADATNADAVGRIFAAKGRPANNPLIVHVADAAMARRHAREWSPAAERLSALWPGPLTLVVPRSGTLPAALSAGLDTIGLRVPAPAVSRQLIAAVGRPLAAPSANRSEHVSPTCAEHVRADLDGRIELILDSGPTEVGLESTVVDLRVDPPQILRPGPLGVEALAPCRGPTGGPDGAAPDPARSPARSPGQHHRHYAPRAPALRVDTPRELDALCPGPDDVVMVVGAEEPTVAHSNAVVLPDPVRAGQRLYAALRACDERRPRRILIVMPPDTPAWLAIRDRLRRATRPGLPPRG